MKSLYSYIQEEMAVASSGINATPANTMGIGNPGPVSAEEFSEPLVGSKPCPKRKKSKKYKKF